jgi:hypothetical protein
MTISNSQAARLALVPGAAEFLERYAVDSAGNMAWDGMIKDVKYARNALYLGMALTAIGAAGATLSVGDNTTRQYVCATVATLGAGVTILAAKRLYGAATFFQRVISNSYTSLESTVLQHSS